MLMGRVLSKDELLQLAGRQARGRGRVVFTNGCFDLLHPGHIQTLEAARSLGEILVVGINSDRSVRALKGGERPIVTESERAEVLAAMQAVDFVVIFDSETPQELIASLLPDILVKGADWGANEIVGRAEVEAAGGRVVSIPMQPGYSTTGILKQVRNTPEKTGPQQAQR
jgi:rfaE bifunctional protein nucleotidyltransferase chain/domain